MSEPIELLKRWLRAIDGGWPTEPDDVLVADTRRTVTRFDDRGVTLSDGWGPWLYPDERPSLFDVSARITDPDSSHDTVRSIAVATALKAQIMDVAQRLGEFDDGDLTAGIRHRYGTSPDRNIVARARGLLEPSGVIVRIGPKPRPDRHVATVHFQHWSHHDRQT